MAKFCSAMDGMRIARVDPEHNPVTIHQLRCAAPKRLTFLEDLHVKIEPSLIPTRSNFGKRALAIQARKVR